MTAVRSTVLTRVPNTLAKAIWSPVAEWKPPGASPKRQSRSRRKQWIVAATRNSRELGLERLAIEGTGYRNDRPAELPGDVIVHNHAAPGVRPPFGTLRLGLGDDGQRRLGQSGMCGQGEKYLPVGKSYVGDHHQIHLRGGQLVGCRHGFVRPKDPRRDDRPRIDPPGILENSDIFSEIGLRTIFVARIEDPDRVDDPADFGRPLLPRVRTHTPLREIHRNTTGCMS